MRVSRVVDRVWIVSVLVLSAACAGARRGEAFRPEVVAGDQAAMYVYCDRSAGAAVRVFVDQEDAGELRPGEYIVRVVKPGEHFVRVEGSSSMARSMVLATGDAAYCEITTEGWKKAPVLSVPDEAAARRRIAGNVRVP